MVRRGSPCPVRRSPCSATVTCASKAPRFSTWHPARARSSSRRSAAASRCSARGSWSMRGPIAPPPRSCAARSSSRPPMATCCCTPASKAWPSRAAHRAAVLRRASRTSSRGPRRRATGTRRTSSRFTTARCSPAIRACARTHRGVRSIRSRSRSSASTSSSRTRSHASRSTRRSTTTRTRRSRGCTASRSRRMRRCSDSRCTSTASSPSPPWSSACAPAGSTRSSCIGVLIPRCWSGPAPGACRSACTRCPRARTSA